MKIRTTIEHSWTSNANAIVNKVYTGAWGFDELTPGSSTVVRLYRSDFVLGTFDGLSYYEIVFQLPLVVRHGQTFHLNPIPLSRPTRRSGEYDRLAEMKDGEITAFRYGNPNMGWMRQTKEASVEIIAVTATEAVIHLRLRADLDPDWDFDMDEQFTLKITSTQR